MAEDDQRKSTKRARSAATSGQLKAAVKRETAAAKVPAKPADTRLYTCEQWARGRVDPITRAFVSEHARKRTEKHTPAEWMALYLGFLKQPRG